MTEEIFKELRKYFKERKFWTEKRDPFRVLISTILSQRTRDKNTDIASNNLFKLAETPKQILNLKDSVIEKAIKKSGFYKVKTKRIKEVCGQLIKDFDGEVPDNIDDLLKLRGVGRKTANCVLCFAYQENVIPVDVHVHRISNRLGLVKTKKPEETEIELMKKLPKKCWKDVNEYFVRYGQEICRPVSPKCPICVIQKNCSYYKVLRQGSKPVNKKPGTNRN